MTIEEQMKLPYDIKKELITPEIASAWLATMDRNRKIRPARVRLAKQAIRNGEFSLSNDLICIDVNNHLVNGQHRLTAVCETGKPICAFVWYGVPEGIVIDRGAPRSLSDSLYMRGLIKKELSKNDIIAFINAYLRLTVGSSNSITDDKKAAFINAHYEDVLMTNMVQKNGSTSAICRKAGVGAGIFAAILSGVDEEKLLRFGEVVNSGYSNDDSESAAITLRHFLTENPTSNKGGGIADIQASWTQQAIRDFVKGKSRHMKYTKINQFYITQELKEEVTNGYV